MVWYSKTKWLHLLAAASVNDVMVDYKTAVEPEAKDVTGDEEEPSQEA